MDLEPTVRSPTVPSTTWFVAGSSPMEPEQYTMPWHLMAWEKNGNGGGALSVLTSSFWTIVTAEEADFGGSSASIVLVECFVRG